MELSASSHDNASDICNYCATTYRWHHHSEGENWEDYETNALVRQDVVYACVSQSSSLMKVYIITRLMA